MKDQEVNQTGRRENHQGTADSSRLAGFLCELCVLCGHKVLGMRRKCDVVALPGCPVSPPVAAYSSGFLLRQFIGAGRNSRGTATHPLAPRGIATELDRCQTGVSCGLAAAHLRCRHSGGAGRIGRHRVSQTAGTRPGNRHYGFLPEIQPGRRVPAGTGGPVRQKIQNLHHGDTHPTKPKPGLSGTPDTETRRNLSQIKSCSGRLTCSSTSHF